MNATQQLTLLRHLVSGTVPSVHGIEPIRSWQAPVACSSFTEANHWRSSTLVSSSSSRLRDLHHHIGWAHGITPFVERREFDWLYPGCNSARRAFIMLARKIFTGVPVVQRGKRSIFDAFAIDKRSTSLLHHKSPGRGHNFSREEVANPLLPARGRLSVSKFCR